LLLLLLLLFLLLCSFLRSLFFCFFSRTVLHPIDRSGSCGPSELRLEARSTSCATVERGGRPQNEFEPTVRHDRYDGVRRTGIGTDRQRPRPRVFGPERLSLRQVSVPPFRIECFRCRCSPVKYP
jgi:hypothetical protein